VPKERLQSYDTERVSSSTASGKPSWPSAGYSAVTWPKDLGGSGCDLTEWLIFEEEYWAADAPARVNQNGILLLGSTLMEFGTPEQKARFLPAWRARYGPRAGPSPTPARTWLPSAAAPHAWVTNSS
jgi:hypothetical protein